EKHPEGWRPAGVPAGPEDWGRLPRRGYRQPSRDCHHRGQSATRRRKDEDMSELAELAMQEAERIFLALGSMTEAAAERAGVPREEISKQLWAVMTGYVLATGIE